METSQVYIAISIIVLVIVALFVAFRSGNGDRRKLTPLAGLAFGFVFAGLFCSDNRVVGYSLIGVGITLSVIDIIVKFRGNRGGNG